MARRIILQAIDPISGRPLGPPRFAQQPAPQLTAEPVAPAAPAARANQPYPERGTIEQVLSWVGYDPDRAKAATAAEHGRDKPRKTLLAELSERTG